MIQLIKNTSYAYKSSRRAIRILWSLFNRSWTKRRDSPITISGFLKVLCSAFLTVVFLINTAICELRNLRKCCCKKSEGLIFRTVFTSSTKPLYLRSFSYVKLFNVMLNLNLMQPKTSYTEPVNLIDSDITTVHLKLNQLQKSRPSKTHRAWMKPKYNLWFDQITPCEFLHVVLKNHCVDLRLWHSSRPWVLELLTNVHRPVLLHIWVYLNSAFLLLSHQKRTKKQERDFLKRNWKYTFDNICLQKCRTNFAFVLFEASALHNFILPSS